MPNWHFFGKDLMHILFGNINWNIFLLLINYRTILLFINKIKKHNSDIIQLADQCYIYRLLTYTSERIIGSAKNPTTF